MDVEYGEGERNRALMAARALRDLGFPIDDVLANPAVPEALRPWVAEQLDAEENRVFEPVRVIARVKDRPDWIAERDRSGWHYWPALRQYLLTQKHWPIDAVRSLDESSDRVLRFLEPPETSAFDTRGLVLGYVQSGKTANFTALIAKAADAGYRLVIVLSGIDNGLRKQTQVRLTKELVGYPDGRAGAVRLPPEGLRWHQFTSDDVNGDFQAGRANHAALQVGQPPVLIVAKKNSQVLRRLRHWLDAAPADVHASLPVLVVDDEADQASIDVRGSYQQPGEELDDDYEEPSVINGHIRALLNTFSRRAYVAYTATPFANILIPHDTEDPQVGADLYPRDFFVDLPKPPGYFGAEEFFGRLDAEEGEERPGLDVIRLIPPADLAWDDEGTALPPSLDEALLAFVLAGAARACRGDSDEPCTMLVHTSVRIVDQARTRARVEQKFQELRDEWRYDRKRIEPVLKALWEREFVPTIKRVAAFPVLDFSTLRPFIGPFFEAIEVREINSETGEVLDYEKEPSLKAIAVGGNRLSRGLTLGGLLISYFSRTTKLYDTLMQMGRWFGYREGYQDLIRVYTTEVLSSWFSDLAEVEHRLRQDLKVYEDANITPLELGMRIRSHPVMQVTGPLKRRFATDVTISQTYAENLGQTFKFPFSNPERLAELCEANRITSRDFIFSLGKETEATDFGPLWDRVPADKVIEFLRTFDVVPEATGVSVELMAAYIEKQVARGELVDWTVAVRGRDRPNEALGQAEWLPNWSVYNLERTRLASNPNSLGVITNPGDEAFGLSAAERAKMEGYLRENVLTDRNRAARRARSERRGLLIFYPISKFSGHGGNRRAGRIPLYQKPEGGDARDLIGLAVSFSPSLQPQQVEAYLEGTARWRPL